MGVRFQIIDCHFGEYVCLVTGKTSGVHFVTLVERQIEWGVIQFKGKPILKATAMVFGGAAEVIDLRVNFGVLAHLRGHLVAYYTAMPFPEKSGVISGFS